MTLYLLAKGDKYRQIALFVAERDNNGNSALNLVKVVQRPALPELQRS